MFEMEEKKHHLSGRCNHTYLTGIYLAMNAVPDLYVLIDSPPFCVIDKLFYVQKTHDLLSDMFRRDTIHRLASTGVDGSQFVHDRTPKVEKTLASLLAQEGCSAVFLAAMPVAQVLAVDYSQMIAKAKEKTKKLIAELPSRGMYSEWLAGYEEAMLTLAKTIPLKGKKQNKKTDIAMIGNLFDRNEGDCTGNISELRRILGALSLDLKTVWFDGSGIDSLKKAGLAGTIISLPYARKAAKHLADRTGADLIEADLPIGLQGTTRFIRQISKRLNINKTAETFIEKELDQAVPLVGRMIPGYFQDRNVSINADPYLAEALAKSLEEIGVNIKQRIFFCSKKYFQSDERNAMFEPMYTEVAGLDYSEIDMVIGTSQIKNILRHSKKQVPYTELGYPSEDYHCLTSSPTFGFRGFINILNRIMND
jgi:nitrogenase molybdenum-iron protein alpha/beta subunit